LVAKCGMPVETPSESHFEALCRCYHRAPPHGFLRPFGNSFATVEGKIRRDLQSDPHVEETWSRIKDDLRAAFPDSVYQIWLSSLKPLRIDRSTIYLEAPKQIGDWVKRRFGSALGAAVGITDPSLQRVEIVSAQEASAARTFVPAAQPQARRSSSLKLTRSFDSFVIGDGNRFAHAAALSVAELPGHSYNPLLLYGPSGVGKSHLLQAIGSYVSEHDDSARIHFTTAECFTGDFTTALRRDHIDDFKRTYRECDLLLLDDIQFLLGKERTAEELLHTIDSALAAGAQVALSSDRHPCELELLTPRLRERLQAGLVIDVPPAESGTRLTILRKLAVSFPGIADQDDVLQHLAHSLPSNGHTLAGALTRLAAYVSLTSAELTTSLAEELLHQLYPQSATAPSTPTVAHIQSTVAALLDLTTDDLHSPKRGRRLVYARQLAMYLCRELTPQSLPAISSQFGGRDHTTVLHGHRKIRELLLTDPYTQRMVRTALDALASPVHKFPQASSPTDVAP
jgi:chromosomal replication initiator protein